MGKPKGRKAKAAASKKVAAAAVAKKSTRRTSKRSKKSMERQPDPEARHEEGPEDIVMTDSDEDLVTSNQGDDLEMSSPDGEISRHTLRPLSPFQPPISFSHSVGDDDVTCQDEDTENHFSISKRDKKVLQKPGILYLSSIPPGYNVSRTTMFFSQFGQVGRVFLQPDEKEKARSKDNFSRNFTEGWVEFMSKTVAKNVADNLNNTSVGGKKRSKAHDVIWNIKYLSKFKWAHLTERLAYEKAVHHQKMRTEISQAKREAGHFKEKVEQSKRFRRSKQNL